MAVCDGSQGFRNSSALVLASRRSSGVDAARSPTGRTHEKAGRLERDDHKRCRGSPHVPAVIASENIHLRVRRVEGVPILAGAFGAS